jgi:hypothetical protein
MNDWLHNLPIAWMGVLIFGLTALVTAALYVLVMGLVLSDTRTMSAIPPKADIAERDRHVRFVPKADISSYSITSSARASSALHHQCQEGFDHWIGA